LTVREGEILGIAGLVGSGRTELALTVFGITPATSGEILVDGKPLMIDRPRVARDLGIAYIPEDRGLQGLIRTQTLRENVSLPVLDRISWATIVDPRGEERRAREAIDRFGIRARGTEQIARQLSGGGDCGRRRRRHDPCRREPGRRLMDAVATAALAPKNGRLARIFAAYGQELVVLGLLLAVIALSGAVNARFLSENNLNSIFSGNAYVAVAAIGLSMVIIAGHIDASVGSLIGLTAT